MSADTFCQTIHNMLKSDDTEITRSLRGPVLQTDQSLRHIMMKLYVASAKMSQYQRTCLFSKVPGYVSESRFSFLRFWGRGTHLLKIVPHWLNFCCIALIV